MHENLCIIRPKLADDPALLYCMFNDPWESYCPWNFIIFTQKFKTRKVVVIETWNQLECVRWPFAHLAFANNTVSTSEIPHSQIAVTIWLVETKVTGRWPQTWFFQINKKKKKNEERIEDLILIRFDLFSSPELKAQVSFSDRLLSVVCLSVCPSVWRLSVRLLHFQLLLQNRWANFNQSWHKSSLGKEDSELYKWRTPPFPKGR
jgi:hypothetical protein